MKNITYIAIVSLMLIIPIGIYAERPNYIYDNADIISPMAETMNDKLT